MTNFEACSSTRMSLSWCRKCSEQMGCERESIQEYLNYKHKINTLLTTHQIFSYTIWRRRVRSILNPIQLQSSIFIIMIRASTSKIAQQLLLRSIQLFSVRVRYAPSPTGFMHVGGLRTALFNYLFARKHKGQFIVRIEDTDKNREVEGSLENIFETLEWIGANADESIKKEGEFGPYIQSARLPLYKSIEKQLLKSNMAYPCFCKQDHSKQQQHQSSGYNGKCRNLPFDEIKTRILAKEQYAVRIKSDLIPLPKTFHDEVYGDLEFKALDDFIIVRSNGWPTFHLANVVDDWKMKITHVMRGEEWLSNTNKHIYLYRLLGADVPKFVHLPLIKAMNGKKLAKRDPSSAVTFFQTGQYEVEAIKCFLAQMGLNRVSQPSQQQQNQQEIPAAIKQKISKSLQKQKADKDSKGKQAIKKQQQNLKLLTESQMIEQFDLSRVTKVPVKFDIKQLDFLNRLSIKKRWKVAQLIESQMNYFISKTHSLIPSSKTKTRQYIIRFLNCVIERFTFITDIALYKYYFEEPNYFDEEATKDFQKIFGKNALLVKPSEGQQVSFKIQNYDPLLFEKNKKIIHSLRMLLQHVISPQNYSELQIVKRISDFLFQSPELKNEEVYHLLRFVVSGRKSGPNIGQACEVIGREVILSRISAFSTL